MTDTVLGIYSSPRKGGNSDMLLDRALDGAKSAGALPEKIYVRDLSLSGCRECGGCDKTGTCVIQDDMQSVYTKLVDARIIIVSSPVFFYGLPSQLKALIDRCQALWSKRMLEKNAEQRKIYNSGRGYLIAVGATKGKKLFDGIEFTARYFFDALDKSYERGLFFSGIEGRSAIQNHPEYLKQAYDFGKAVLDLK